MINKQIESQNLSVKIIEWELSGGKITPLPTGFSGEFSKGWNDAKATAFTDAKVKKATDSNPNVAARKLARHQGLKQFHGATCRNCQTTERYTANNSCVACNRASNAAVKERMRGAKA